MSGKVGRPRREVDLPRLSRAYFLTGSVRAAARSLGIPPGTAWDKLRALRLV